MANKGFAYGLSAQVAKKIEGKRDREKEEEAKKWIETISEIQFDPNLNYEQNLKNGVILCKLINKIVPKAIKKISQSDKPFEQMENINKFLIAIEKYGVKKTDLFQTVDLFEFSNIPAMTATLFALGRICQTKPEWQEGDPSYKNWPILGPKQAVEHVRQFDQQTIIEGKKVIGIQAGTNKLASQSGQSFGGRRNIN